MNYKSMSQLDVLNNIGKTANLHIDEHDCRCTTIRFKEPLVVKILKLSRAGMVHIELPTGVKDICRPSSLELIDGKPTIDTVISDANRFFTTYKAVFSPEKVWIFDHHITGLIEALNMIKGWKK